MTLALASPVATLGPPVTAAAFRTWLRQARPGERLAYHRGCLTRDRAAGTPLPAPERTRVDALAAAALAAAEAGHVHLVQRRLDASDFVYLAVRAHPPLARPAPVHKEEPMPAHPAPPNPPPTAEETS